MSEHGAEASDEDLVVFLALEDLAVAEVDRDDRPERLQLLCMQRDLGGAHVLQHVLDAQPGLAGLAGVSRKQRPADDLARALSRCNLQYRAAFHVFLPSCD